MQRVTSDQSLESYDLAFLDSERALSIFAKDVNLFASRVFILGYLLSVGFVCLFWLGKMIK